MLIASKVISYYNEWELFHRLFVIGKYQIKKNGEKRK